MLESDGPGGAEVMLLHLAEDLRRRGHEPFHVGPQNGCGWLGDRFRDRGFQTETFRLRRPIDWKCLTGLTGLLRRNGTDVVHSHEFTMSLYGAAAARVISRPHVITHHAGRYYAMKWRRRFAMRWACKSSDTVTAVSNVTRLELENGLGLAPGSVRVVYNGIPHRPGVGTKVRKEVGAQADDVLIVAVGTMEPNKNHLAILQALVEIDQRLSQRSWRVVVAGQDRFEKRRLREFANAKGFGDRLHMLGHRDDVADILAAADVFALPSVREGLPVALLEAMMAGVPVVASCTGGVPEVITSENEGLLTPVGDVGGLAAALERLLRRATLRKKLGEGGRNRALSAFSLEAMGSAYERIYARACSPVQARGPG